jgi:hypothetical protein
MWRLGPPYPAHITLAHIAARWAQGVQPFGGAATIGSAVGQWKISTLGSTLGRKPSDK